MVTVEIDEKNVKQKLAELKTQSPKAAARALNKTAKDARKRLADKARDTYTVKIGGFTNHVKFKKPATAGRLDAELGVDGSPLTLNRFSIRQGGAYAKVLKDGNFKELRNRINALAFKIPGGKAAGLVGQRVRYESLRSRSKHRKAISNARKKGHGYPIKVLHGPSVPKMIGSQKRVYGIVEPHIQSDLNKNIEAEIKKLTG